MQYIVLIETTDRDDLASLPGSVATALVRAAESVPGVESALITQFSSSN